MNKTTPLSAAPSDAPPLGVDDMLCFAAYSSSLAFNRFYKPMLDRMGLTYPQYLVMSLLWQDDAQTVGGLGERLFLESNTVTPLVKRLEAMGLVRRERDARDERVVRVRLTDAGTTMAQEANCLPQAVLDATGLSPQTIEALRDGLVALREKLRAAA